MWENQRIFFPMKLIHRNIGINMYIYVDESGNTGNNMFDKNQPDFFLCGCISKRDIEKIYTHQFKSLLNKYSINELHGNEIGLSKLNIMAVDILKFIKKANLKFIFIVIDKYCFSAIKLFDTIFDQGENIAVPFHCYWDRNNRYILLYNFMSLQNRDLVEKFSKFCLNSTNMETSKKVFINVLNSLLLRLEKHSFDNRTTEIFKNAFTWAIKNTENITYCPLNKQNLLLGSPNVCYFVQLIRISEQQRLKWKHDKCTIIHDEQSQFKSTINDVHNVFSASSAPEFINIGYNETCRFRLLENSHIFFKSSKNCAGIQIADCALYITKNAKKIIKKRSEIENLRDFIYKSTLNKYYVTFDEIKRTTTCIMNNIFSTPYSENEELKAREFLNKIEINRINALQNYEIKKKESIIN